MEDLIKRARDCLFRCTDRLLIEGTTPWELDDALRDAGFDLPPCEAMDLIGLDQVYAERDHSLASKAPEHRHLITSRRMLTDGRIGKRAGVGWFRYPGGGGKVEDPLVEDNLSEEAWLAKLDRREIPEAELVETVFDALRRFAASPENAAHPDLKQVFSTQLYLGPQALAAVFPSNS